MKLDLDRSPLGSSRLELEGDVELGLPEGTPNHVHVSGDLEVENLESRILVGGQLQATGEMTCSRCLEVFRLSWDVEISCMVLRDTLSQEGQDDSMVLHQRKGVADLAEIVRESVILAFPHAAVCSAGCRGLCSGCGKNLNNEACICEAEDHDPRWDALP